MVRSLFLLLAVIVGLVAYVLAIVFWSLHNDHAALGWFMAASFCDFYVVFDLFIPRRSA